MPTDDHHHHHNHHHHSTNHYLPAVHKTRKLAGHAVRSQRPRRHAAGPNISYAEPAGSLSPEPHRSMSSSARRTSSIPASAADFGDMSSRGSPARHHRASSSNSSDAGGDAPLTKTGRPSRALKGKKVHKCDICDRVYTRNEHLRRHQLNHSSEILRCPVDGCRKVFQRADLLKRHREEHNDEHSAFARRGSASIDQLGPRTDSPALNSLINDPMSGLGMPVSNALGLDHSFASNNIDRRQSYPWDVTSPGSSPSTFQTTETNIAYIGGPVYDPIEGSDLCTLSTFPEEWKMPMALGESTSPAAASPSSTFYDSSHVPANTWSSPADSDLSGSSAPFPVMDPNFAGSGMVPSGRTYWEELDASEEATILKDVASMAASMPGMEGQTRLERLEAEYLESFWSRFDPMFSVIHRHTFEAYGTSPLVRGLMIAIGAQYSESEHAQAMARTLRESCSKLMQRRVSLDYSRARLWDLQAVFLHEIFSVYCSRRPNSRFSQRFEDLLTGLVADKDNLFYTTPLGTLRDLRKTMPTLEGECLRFRWFDLESKRRLLLACYVLEVQQNSLFGSHRPVSANNLPAPCSQGLWEAYTCDEWLVMSQHETGDTRPLSEMLADSRPGTTPQFDSFLSNVAIAHGAHATYFGVFNSVQDARYPIAHTAQCIFSFEAAQLASYAPVQDLLAVSGETFVLGQKLASQGQYDEALANLRRWMTTPNAAAAVDQARKLFRLAFEEGRIGTLHEDWALTLAALVLWAVAMWPKQYEVQDLARSTPVDHAEEKARAAVYGAEMDYLGARACLAYCRRRMEGRLGWLVQDASGTLGKLVEGRIIDVVHEAAA